MIQITHDFSCFERLEESTGASPSPWQRRILAQLRYALLLSQANHQRFAAEIDQAEKILLASLNAEGTITNSAAQKAEEALLPCGEEAKSYEFLCVAHAHIDMNWMWGFHETVGATVDTMRTMLQLMEEYPDFKFSQSQASIYRILERFAPEMLEEVKKRIAEGRWEVTASTWVETDKNMPSSESLSRQYLLAKRYLSGLLNLNPQDLCIDFEPDTFGHSEHVPELAANAGVRYYYHCRGRLPEDMIIRWRAPSGAELLLYTEPDWYNGEIGPSLAEQALELAGRTGSRTLLKVYGVGDHGGGPTRRDLDMLLEMNRWPVYPSFRFSTLRAYYDLLEQRRETFPVVEGELNFLCDGCYTTQTRIKTGNRRSERLLSQAELFSAEASLFTDRAYPAGIFDDAWEKVLFNHFHDIIPGSGVTETREYASALYQEVGAAGETRRKQAFYELSERMNTAPLLPEQALPFSRGHGGGAGFRDTCGRSGGKTRIFHVFQSLPWQRTEAVEFVVWDYEGAEDRICVKTSDGVWLNSQVLETGDYWGHHFVRLTAVLTIPACGWTTCTVGEKPVEPGWTVLNDMRVQHPDCFRLENSKLCAVFNSLDGKLISLKEKLTGSELISGPAGFSLATEGVNKAVTGWNGGMSAWFTGRHRSQEPLRNIELRMLPGGPVRSRLELKAQFGTASTLHAEIYLDAGSEALQYKVTCDWREFGSNTAGIPCLLFTVPEALSENDYLFEVPSGFARRAGQEMDLPSTRFVLAGEQAENALMLSAKEKYGYRCGKGRMSLTLIRAAYDPDPTPEIGRHEFSFALFHAAGKQEAAAYSRLAQAYENSPIAVSGRPHSGDLPIQNAIIELEPGSALLSGIKGSETGEPGTFFVRLYETGGKTAEAVLRCAFEIQEAFFADTLENPAPGSILIQGNQLHIPLTSYQLANIKIIAKK